MGTAFTACRGNNWMAGLGSTGGALGGYAATWLVGRGAGSTGPQCQGTQDDGHFNEQFQQDRLVLVRQAHGAGESEFTEAGTFLIDSGERCDEQCGSLGWFRQSWQEVGGGCHGKRANLRCLME